jgi:hypothetical protein
VDFNLSLLTALAPALTLTFPSEFGISHGTNVEPDIFKGFKDTLKCKRRLSLMGGRFGSETIKTIERRFYKHPSLK